MSNPSLGNIQLFRYNPKPIKVDKLRLPSQPTNEDLAREISKLNDLVYKLSTEIHKFETFYDLDNVDKTNKLKPAVERTTKRSGDTIINTIIGSGSSGGGSVSTSDITTVSVSLTGGIASPQVFSSPATLVSVPIGFSTVDGMTSAEILAPTSLTVTGFTIQSLQDCVAIFSYKTL